MIAPYVVQAGTNVTWGGETLFVRRCRVVMLDPANTALWNAYGGSSNLLPLPPGQHSDIADHSTIGD